MKRMQIVAAFAVVLGLIATSAWADFKLERKLALEPGGSFILETDIGVSAPDRRALIRRARLLITSDEDLDRDFEFAFSEEGPRGQGHDQAARCYAPAVHRVVRQPRHPHRRFSVPSKTAVRLSTSGGSVKPTRT